MTLACAVLVSKTNPSTARNEMEIIMEDIEDEIEDIASAMETCTDILYWTMIASMIMIGLGLLAGLGSATKTTDDVIDFLPLGDVAEDFGQISTEGWGDMMTGLASAGGSLMSIVGIYCEFIQLNHETSLKMLQIRLSLARWDTAIDCS